MKEINLPSTAKIISLALVFCLANTPRLAAESVPPPTVIAIATARSQITLLVGADRHLYQLGFGITNNAVALPTKAPDREREYYPPTGDGYLFEPALAATHADGNTSTDLQFIKQESSEIDSNICLLYTSPSPRDGLLSRMPSSA